MCDQCENPSAPTGYNRRNFLKFAGAAAAGLALANSLRAAPQGEPPKPQNVLTPDQALERLMAGNERYIDGLAKRHDFIPERPALVRGQNPYAGILGCADSRVVPEYSFDAGRGDLFIVRAAGNFAGDDAVASFEYTVKFLGTPLLMVLGHQSCGAVQATISSVKDGAKLPGHIPLLAKHIAPAVKYSMEHPTEDLLDESIKQNVILNVAKLKATGPIISKLVSENKVKVVGGVYHLDTGRVELVA